MSDDDEEHDELRDDAGVPADGEADLEALAEEDPAAAFEQVGELPGTHLRAAEFWDDIVGDMEATADEYETEGWETLQLHPGDVTALVPEEDDDRFGIDVLVPDDEFAELESLLEGEVSFDSYEAFRAMADGLVLFVVAMEDPDAEVAVLYPAYYDAENARGMLAAAEQAGEMRTYVRTLTNEQVEFTHEDPENFAPQVDGETDEAAESN
ncbi:hypothetical protein M0R89_07940 [Halorussus limi]|uniref:Uncharacterized protein n=1 Tax=Halorussus limi TaxID=2938695 RepID=A0A8U0HYQ4_9EURY|nr:hypothetical protein [Halorussus limi]UPV75979.1 hypothetical protein M0R89_07940 [Halorussus limi]